MSLVELERCVGVCIRRGPFVREDFDGYAVDSNERGSKDAVITYGYSLSKSASFSAISASSMTTFVDSKPLLCFFICSFAVPPSLGGPCGNASCSERLQLWVHKPHDDFPRRPPRLPPVSGRLLVAGSGGDSPDVC